MNLLSPHNVLWFVAIPLATLLIVIAYKRRIKNIQILSANLNFKFKLYPRLILTLAILILISLALLRPYSGFTDVIRSSAGTDNLLIIDVSDSMRAKDVSPSRIEIAKRKSLDLMSLLREENLGHRIGIVLFAGQAYLYCPPTADFGALKQFIDSISPDLITAQGSGINLALSTAISVIERTKMKEPQLYIFTDGEDVGFKFGEASSLLISANLNPLILGIGTTAGSPIDIPGRGFIKDSSGKIVVSRLSEDTLRKLATDTGGKYVSVSIGTNDLKTLLGATQSSSQLSTNKGEKIVRVYDEFGHLFLWVALLLLIISIGLRKYVPLFSLLLLLLLNQSAVALPPNAFEAWRLYNEEKFAEAEPGFREALKNNPQSLDLTQALGSSLYKQGKYSEAADLFSRLASEGKTRREVFDGNFNLGNTYLQSKDYQKAIQAYEESLKVEPESEPAQFNLELAKKLLEKKENEKKEEPQKQEEQKQDQSQESKDSEQQNEAPQEEQSKDEPNDSKSNSEDPQKNETNTDSSQESSDLNEEKNTNPTEELKAESSISESEAERWLDSLPDAPILIQKKNDRQKVTNGQTW